VKEFSGRNDNIVKIEWEEEEWNVQNAVLMIELET
jgi:hypothetical protein